MLWLAKVKEEARHSGQELEEEKTRKAKGREPEKAAVVTLAGVRLRGHKMRRQGGTAGSDEVLTGLCRVDCAWSQTARPPLSSEGPRNGV